MMGADGNLGERFGVQVVQILSASENRSKAYWKYASRGSQEATTEMGRMGAEPPARASGRAY
jgi:hypothetical protein